MRKSQHKPEDSKDQCTTPLRKKPKMSLFSTFSAATEYPLGESKNRQKRREITKIQNGAVRNPVQNRTISYLTACEWSLKHGQDLLLRFGLGYWRWSGTSKTDRVSGANWESSAVFACAITFGR